MKNTYTTLHFFLFLMAALGVTAQAPKSFNYQAVMRNAQGDAIVSENVTVQISLLKEGTEEVFSETHHTQTNSLGLIHLQIGSVNPLDAIEWGGHNYFIEVRLNGELMGASPLLSVPYALHAQSSADAFSGDYHDLENTPDLSAFVSVPEPETGDMAYYTPEGWQRIPFGTEGQILAISNGLPQWVDAPFEFEPGPVWDADGNEYPTIAIGNQVWMGANLRTTQYSDGTTIPTGLDNTAWSQATEGAYAIYPHSMVEGVNSDEEMVETYGKLYNFYAVSDPRGLCPAGWRVATADDYDELVMYVAYWGGGNKEKNPESVAGNYLKSCRQINSPMGGECDTQEHPRWESDPTHFSTNEFDFEGIPAGRRDLHGNFNRIGTYSYYWTSTELSFAMGRWRQLSHSGGWLYSGFEYKEEGYTVRCIRED